MTRVSWGANGFVASACCLLLILLGGCQATTRLLAPSKDETAAMTMSAAEVFGLSVASLPTTRPAKTDRIDPEATLDYMKARVAIVNGLHNEAIQHLLAALKTDDAYVAARQLLAKTYLDRGRTDAAFEQAETLLKQDPANVTGHYVAGTVLLRSDRFAEGGGHLYRAILLAERAGEGRSAFAMMARFALGQALANKNHIAAAVEVYLPLLRYLNEYDEQNLPNDRYVKRLYEVCRPSLHIIIAGFLCRLDRPEEAEPFYVRARQFPELSFRAQLGLINCYRQMGRSDLARDLLDELATSGNVDAEVIELYQKLYDDQTWPDRLLKAYTPDRRTYPVAVALAETLMTSGHWDHAATLLDALIRLEPADTHVLAMTVRAYRRIDKLDRCAELLIEVLSSGTYIGVNTSRSAAQWDDASARALGRAVAAMTIDPSREFARAYLRGQVDQTLGHLSRAKKHYQQSCVLNETFVPGYLSWANVLLLERKWEAVLEVAETAMKRTGQTASLLYVKGRALSELDRFDEAVRILRDAHRLNPESDAICSALVEAYLRARNPVSAMRLLRRVISSNMVGRETLGELIEILLNSNRLGPAEQVLERYKELFGRDGRYELLAARLSYAESPDRDAYRSTLKRLQQASSLRAGVVDIELATLELQSDNYRLALEIVDRLLRRSQPLWPEDYQRALHIKAAAHHRLLEYDQAERAWKRLLADWPGRESFKRGLARMYFDAQEFDKGEGILTELIETTRDDELKRILLHQIVWARLHRDDVEGAVALVKQRLDEASANQKGELQELLLRCYLTKKRYDDAAELLEGLMAERPKQKHQWQQTLVAVLIKQGRGAEAIEKVDAWLAETKDTKDRDLIERFKIPVYLELKRFDEAIELTRKHWESSKGHQNVVLAVTLIRCYRQAEQYGKAEAFATEQIKAYPPDSAPAMMFNYQLIRTWQASGQFARAEKYILDNVESAQPAAQDEWYQWLVATVYFSSNQYDKAMALLEKLLAKNPSLSWASNSLGYVFADKGRQLDRAERLIRGALAHEPDNAAYLDSLGWVLHRKGKYLQAQHYLQMAETAAVEDDPVMLDHLGDVKAALGQTDQARRYWKRALEEAEDYDPAQLEPGLRERVITKLEKTADKATRETTTRPSTRPATRPATCNAQ